MKEDDYTSKSRRLQIFVSAGGGSSHSITAGAHSTLKPSFLLTLFQSTRQSPRLPKPIVKTLVMIGCRRCVLYWSLAWRDPVKVVSLFEPANEKREFGTTRTPSTLRRYEMNRFPNLVALSALVALCSSGTVEVNINATVSISVIGLILLVTLHR